LGQHIDAVAVVFNHPLQARDLAGDPVQPAADELLVLGVAWHQRSIPPGGIAFWYCVQALTQAPIGEYALLGDTRSAALISRRGSIDWLCLPRFDADPVFGLLIDAEHGGRFELSVAGEVEARSYRAESAVLETHWRAPSGIAT